MKMTSPKIQFTLSANKKRKGRSGSSSSSSSSSSSVSSANAHSKSNPLNASSDNSSSGGGGGCSPNQNLSKIHPDHSQQHQKVKKKKNGFHNVFLESSSVEQSKNKPDGSADDSYLLSGVENNSTHLKQLLIGELESESEKISSTTLSPNSSNTDSASGGSAGAGVKASSENASGTKETNPNDDNSISKGGEGADGTTTTALQSQNQNQTQTAAAVATTDEDGDTDMEDCNNNSQSKKSEGGNEVPQNDSKAGNTSRTAPSPTANPNLVVQQQQQRQLHQPSGWRVKLYRLNTDGSWDDCGTGRICLIRKNIAKQEATTNVVNANAQNQQWQNQNQSPLQRQQQQQSRLTKEEHYHKMEEEIYHMLGEPTLFMHAEMTNTTNTNTAAASVKTKSNVLLRTRVLLKEFYQRQGDNIITWCESFFPTSTTTAANNDSKSQNSDDKQQQQEGNMHDNSNRENQDQQQQQFTGVDLALSFQDNAGCLDIWNKISSIQRKAYELFEAKNRTNVVSSLMGHGAGLPTSSPVDGEGRGGVTLVTGEHAQHHQQQQGHEQNMNINNGASSTQTSGEPTSGINIPMIHDSTSGTPPSDKSNTTNGVITSSLSDQSQQEQANNAASNHWITTSTNISSNTNATATRSEQENNNSIGVLGKYDVDENNQEEHKFIEAEATAVSMAAQYVGSGGHLNHNNDANNHNCQNNIQQQQEHNQVMHMADSPDGNIAVNSQLPNPPKLGNLEEIADIIAASQPQQREAISLFISISNCAYLKALLALFPAAEEKDDYNTLATLASIIKTIFLFNEPGIIQLIASDGKIFEDCCCCLEYDPDLRSKANHRWFIRDRLKFRTVVFMEDQELVETIHKSFRVTYIRDTLLRPTMDESSLTTLGSLLTFTHADVVKGVMCAPDPSRIKLAKSSDSYLVQVLRLLGKEIRAIREAEWGCTDQDSSRHDSIVGHADNPSGEITSLSPSSSYESPDTPWKQHLAPQDESISSRKIRRRGCLSFLRELFNMVRMSLQQSDKDDFYNLLVVMDVELDEMNRDSKENNPSSQVNQTVNLLSLLGAILSDINSDVSERGACLEILSVIAMFDASLIRKHCLVEFSSSENEGEGSKLLNRRESSIGRPQPDHKNNITFICPPNDLLLSLLFVMIVENDAGIMLQTSEIMRIILDTEMMNESCQLGGVAVVDNEDEFPLGSRGNGSFQFGPNTTHGGAEGGSEQNSFLQMFYDHYVPWFVAPFQYKTMVCRSAVPFSLIGKGDDKFPTVLHRLQNESKNLFQEVIPSALRLSFSVEILSFCVRAHCYRMKRYLLNSRVLNSVVKLLSPKSNGHIVHGDRCLKLAVLRCLRSILSLKDEFYNRYIVQNNLFTPVFDAFRANPVGDNLVSSSIMEMCDFVRNENIKSIIEHIATKHLCEQTSSADSNDNTIKRRPSLEDFATPYVDTLTLLRKKYEENVGINNSNSSSTENSGIKFNGGDQRIIQSEKALEDQRKFREADAEDSYFFDDVEDSGDQPRARPPSPAPLNPLTFD